MSQPLSRRTVATGAAWSIPVVAVTAAAPARAASVLACTSVTSLSGTHRNGQPTASMTAQVNGLGSQVCITSLTATGGGNGSTTLSFSGSACGTATITFSAPSSDNGNNVKGSYTGTALYTVGGSGCSQAVTFTIVAA